MKRLLLIVKWLAYMLAGFLFIVFISLQAYRIYLEKSTEIKTPNGISSLEEITLGGLKQWIFIRGEDQNNPIMIFLHGGPGASAPGMPSSRKLDAELIKHFTVVHWDQRGAGKSYDNNIPVTSMTMDRFVEDCKELIDYVRNRFNVQKVFLVAHSSGTVTGIKTAHRYPEKIHAYVGAGQIIHDHEQIRLAYDFIIDEAERSGDVKMQNSIKAIGPPPYETPEKLYEMQNYVFQLGGVIHEDSVKQIGNLMLSFFTSPEYSISDGINSLMMKGLFFSVSAMWDEINDIDITKEIRSIKVPVYFFEGRYDMATPSVLVKEFYDGLDAVKGKKLIIFENSAHMPMIEEKEKYEDLLINLVLKENLSGTLIRIMPLGDSITQGAADADSYRRPLWKLLKKAKARIDFVGSMKMNYPDANPPYSDFDIDHEGHWGWRTDQILARIDDWAGRAVPDIVLLHLGTNDIFQHQENEGTVEEITGIITTLRKHNPRVKIFLAQLIPVASKTANLQIQELNRLLLVMVHSITTDVSPIHIVDQYEGFDAFKDTYDGIHPNDKGIDKMAQRWYEALEGSLTPQR